MPETNGGPERFDPLNTPEISLQHPVSIRDRWMDIVWSSYINFCPPLPLSLAAVCGFEREKTAARRQLSRSY